MTEQGWLVGLPEPRAARQLQAQARRPGENAEFNHASSSGV